QFNTLTGAIQSKSSNPAIGESISVTGYDNIFDGGKGDWVFEGVTGQTPSQSPAQLGGGLFNDKSGNQWVIEKTGTINIRALGAKPLADSTGAIQAAIIAAGKQATELVGTDNRIIFSPVVVDITSGAFLFSDTLTVNKNFVKIQGSGLGSSVLYRTDGTFGDSVVFTPTVPSATRLIGSSISGVKIDARVDMTSGAHLSLVSVSQADFSDIFLENGFVSYHLKGVQNCTFKSTFALVGRYYPTLRAGTKYLHIEEGDFENTEVFFTTFNYGFTINASTEVGIEINEMDGVWFGDGHVLGAQTELLIDGTGSSQLMAGRFDGIWFDGFTTTNIVFKGVAAGSFKDFSFTGCKTSGATSLCVHVESGCNVSTVKFNSHDYENCNGSGVLLEGGDDYSFSGGGFNDIARAATANQYALKVEVASGVTKLNIGGMPISATTIDYGIRILEVNCEALIHDIPFSGVQIDEADISNTAFKGKISNCSTGRANSNDVAAASTILAPAIADVVNVTGGSQTLNTIQNVWDGRSIMLRGDSASHTIAHGGGNILTNGNVNITLNANRGRRLTYSADSGAWYDA
ncbi:MAG: hypothetical protein CMJ25_13490, partial [Phycisphaerae bacterium]|nr:hypothetical protein [Phycisphaerae bacterium]